MCNVFQVQSFVCIVYCEESRVSLSFTFKPQHRLFLPAYLITPCLLYDVFLLHIKIALLAFGTVESCFVHR